MRSELDAQPAPGRWSTITETITRAVRDAVPAKRLPPVAVARHVANWMLRAVAVAYLVTWSTASGWNRAFAILIVVGEAIGAALALRLAYWTIQLERSQAESELDTIRARQLAELRCESERLDEQLAALAALGFPVDEVASDLERQIGEMAAAGASTQEVRAWLQDHVPPTNPAEAPSNTDRENSA